MSAVQTPLPRAASNGERPAAAPVGVKRRRSTPHMLLGAVLVLVCALAFAVTGLRVDPRSPVLALARAVPAGHVLTDADLAVVRIVPDSALGTLSESQRSTVVGRSVRLPLAANSLLVSEVLGSAAWPPAGQSVIAVAVKSGRVPVGLTAGANVLVLVVPASSGASTGSAAPTIPRAQATVVAVAAADTNGTAVVSLLMTSTNAIRVAGAPGEAALVLHGGTE